MRCSVALFAVFPAFFVGCATASDDGLGGGTGHDSGARGVDGRVGDDVGGAPETTTELDTGAVDSSTSSIDTGTFGDDTGSSDVATTDPSCAATSSSTDCETCCYSAHTDAYNAFATALTGCGCKPANCATACAATACASPPTSADTACLSCLKAVQTGACKSDIDAVCSSPSGACYPFARCVITSGCNSKA